MLVKVFKIIIPISMQPIWFDIYSFSTNYIPVSCARHYRGYSCKKDNSSKSSKLYSGSYTLNQKCKWLSPKRDVLNAIKDAKDEEKHQAGLQKKLLNLFI